MMKGSSVGQDGFFSDAFLDRAYSVGEAIEGAQRNFDEAMGEMFDTPKAEYRKMVELQKLEEAISQFTHDRLWGGNVEPLVNNARMILNQL